MNEQIITNRSDLLRIILENGYSTSTVNKIMSLFGNLKPEQKEMVAERATPLVKKAETEQEAIKIMVKLIEQI